MKRFLALVLLLVLFVLSSASSLAQEPEKYRINFELAKELIRVGKPAEALKLINQLRDVYGERKELLELLKEAYLATKEYDKVEEMIRKDLARQPENWSLYCELGDVYLKTQREKEAKLNLNKAIQLAPDRKRVYSKVALIYLKNGFTSEAMDTYKRGRIRLADPSAFAFDLANLYEALSNYKQAIDEYFLFMGDDSTKFNLVEDRINQLIQSGKNLDQIESALSQRIKEDPKDRYSQKLFGDLLFRRKNLSGAFEAYRKVDELYNAKGRYILRFIQMCLNQRWFDQAIRSSQYLLSTHPSPDVAITAELLIARSYEGQEKFTQAIDAYENVIDEYQEIFPLQIAFSHFRIGEIELFRFFKPDEAFFRFQNVILNHKDSELYPIALVRLGDCLMVKGDLDSARTLLLNALKDPKAESREEEIKFKLTEIEFYQGNFQQALEGYNRQVKEFPKGLYVNNSLQRIVVISENQELDRYLLVIFAEAMLDKLQGKIESALKKLDKIISAKSEKLSDLAQLEKAKIYIEQKKFSSSLKALEELLKKYPQSFFCAEAQKLIGDVYNYHLKDSPKAIQAYQKLLKDYGRSVYADEVRDRLRELKPEEVSPSSG